MELGFLFVVLQLIFLEGILSIDNAAVLGAMVSHLPQDEAIPWPGPLRALQKPVHRLLGGQRMAALKVGLLGAYMGRGSMLVLASYVIANPWLRLLGALYLVRLASENLGLLPWLGAAGEEGEHAVGTRSAGRGFWQVVLNVELADLAFSIDNVVAAVALSRELWVVLLGVALGILTMRFAAGIFSRLIEKEPILEPAAYILVLNIGAELLLEEFAGWHFGDVTKFLISMATILLCVGYARLAVLQRVGRYFVWLKYGLGLLDAGFAVVLKPFGWLLGAAVAAVRGQGRAVETQRSGG